MIIGIDGNEANVHSRVGIGEYAFELLRQFSNSKFSPRGEAGKIQNSKFVIYLKDRPLEHMPEEADGWKYRVLKPGKLWTQWRLPLDLYFHKDRPDVFFSPSHYAPRFSPVPTVMSIMDVSYLYFPEMFDKKDLLQLKNWTAYSVKNAKKVLTISRSTKNDIIEAYKTPDTKVIVTYPGIKETVSLEPRIYGMNQVKTKYRISDNYVLFVGTLQPRKNIQKLIEAFAKVLKDENSQNDLQLVIVGKKGWQYEEILSAPEKLSISGSVKFLESVSNDELPIIYKHAKCMILPSLYEGFGLPVLEAMKYDCPVITSKVSSLPEAGGDACLYINPEDVSDISDKIIKLINDDKLRQVLIEKGRKQVEKFSWEKTAGETLKVLEEVGKRS